MSGAVKPVRTYDNRRRTERSRQRQRRVVDATAQLVVVEGYAGTSMAAVAAAAEVSVPWLYKTFGPKPALAKRTYDVLLAGDLDEEPMARREAYLALAASRDLRDQVARHAAIARGITERAGAFTAALLAAARAGEPELRELARTLDGERLIGAEMFVRLLAEAGTLPAGADPELARDVVWLHTSFDVHRLLILDRGWSADAYERWYAESLYASLTGPAVRSPVTS